MMNFLRSLAVTAAALSLLLASGFAAAAAAPAPAAPRLAKKDCGCGSGCQCAAHRNAAAPCTCGASFDADFKPVEVRGVVERIDAEKGTALVKHEEIPGVMRAMTMLFHLEGGALKTLKVGDRIHFVMSKWQKQWWISDVAVQAAAPRY